MRANAIVVLLTLLCSLPIDATAQPRVRTSGALTFYAPRTGAIPITIASRKRRHARRTALTYRLSTTTIGRRVRVALSNWRAEPTRTRNGFVRVFGQFVGIHACTINGNV
jgi:hypothetical protein